ncbi:MAG TPA: hypothetical protein VIH85_06985 [Solirubrobacteraceae bacterium]
MPFLRSICRRLALVGVCVLGGMWVGAGNAWARTVSVNSVAHVAYVGTTSQGLQWAGTVVDPALGNGGLLATFARAGAGYRGTATIVNPNGSLTATVAVAVRLEGHLVRFGITADVTGATGRFTGARGRLTGSALVTATNSVGTLRLHGTLRGASGRAPVPLGGAGVRHVDGRFLGVEQSLARNEILTVIGSVTGLVPGPAVMVAQERVTTTSAHGTLTVFAAGGTLTGLFDVRFPGSGRVRSETGTYTFSRGSGDLSGVHTSPLMVRGTRDLKLQRIATRMEGDLIL